MEMVKVIFWDSRPQVHENLHSTIAQLNPSRHFFQQFMKFSNVLEKGLIGIHPSFILSLTLSPRRYPPVAGDGALGDEESD